MLIDKTKRDSVEVSVVWFFSTLAAASAGLLFIFGSGYQMLDTKKLDKAVYDENQKLIERMAEDIRAIRNVIDQRAYSDWFNKR